jgi:2,5-diketo-D-gluconate reductase B
VPRLGFGTYEMAGVSLQRVLVAALKSGFRHIDTAQIYQNETDVGLAIRESGVPRDGVFVTTKLWVTNYTPARFLPSVDESLPRLQSDYIDLLLVHWPCGGQHLEAQIGGLNAAVRASKARHVGVSNYNAAMLIRAVALSEYPLVTNQVEYHPYLDQSRLLRTVSQTNTSLMAYCPMAVGKVFEEPLLNQIAMRYERTVSQVVLRWLIQQPQVVALSRTTKIERISENLKIFDFELSAHDMRSIGSLCAADTRIVNPRGLAPDWD